MEFNDLAPATTFFILAVITISIGGLILGALVDMNCDNVVASTGDNRTVTNNTYANLTYPNIISGSENVTNASNPLDVVPASNYTMNYTDGGIILNAPTTYNNTLLYVAYDYDTGVCEGTGEYNTSYNYLQGLIVFSDWQSLIGMIIAAAIVIGVFVGLLESLRNF